ncbi:pantothenate kinase [Pseudomonas sp. NCCP-436]|uniref:pantothenate kinase n=1 Tax=Pseudomonas sp. NCCP-436 TaxID=2842481 RepID=UPI001C805F26|nr:pantothenate kinase [Pseudomonas sp. NCCP-436]GIZ13985.1 type III pantothenate kinase [Pseudomonas sp. NCCP-436]
MILELDCGNSFIKWRLLSAREGDCLKAGVVESDPELFEALAQLPGLSPEYCRLVSVRSDVETGQLVSRLRDELGLQVVCAKPALQQGDVRNGYADYKRLGLDRWLAILGAYRLGRRACLVIDLGTAITIDLVSDEGEHLGGFICPGLPLMRDLLGTHTRRIRYDRQAAEEALCSLDPGRATAEAVERGCLLMLRAFVEQQYQQACARFAAGFDVFLTGGDAELVSDIVPRARVVPDLVFVGLAIACPLD